MVVVIFCYLCCSCSNMLKGVLSYWECCDCSSYWKCSFQWSVGLSIWMSQLEGNPAFLSEASSPHKFTGHAGGPEKSLLYRFATFLLAFKRTEIKLPSIEGWCTKATLMMVKSDHHWQKELLCPLLQSDHGVVGLGIWNNSILGVKKKDRPQGNKNFIIQISVSHQ